MRTWIIALGLLLFCFIIPLQVFIIGNDAGFGVQGAVYRYQITSYGDSFMTVTRELTYVYSGLFTGRTALSVVLWAAGTMVLALTTVIPLVYWNRLPERMYRFIILGLVLAGLLCLGSCIAQYGLFFSGSAGISLPLGVLLMVIFAASLWFYRGIFIDRNAGSREDQD